MSTNSNTANKTLIDKDAVEKNISSRDKKNSVNKWLFLLCTLIGLIVLVALLIQTFVKGAGHLTPEFFTNFSSSTPADAGIKGALVGSIWLILSIIPISIILGIGTAIYLEEYARDNIFTQIVKVSISNLAGVPSIVFGLLGYTLFVGAAGLGNSVLAAALTMSLLILPVIIVASQEAIRAVPSSVREASYGLGANKWQTIRRVVLPAALPGILTGFILSLSRALGETAPLVMIDTYDTFSNTKWITRPILCVTNSNLYMGKNASSRIPKRCISRYYRSTRYLIIDEHCSDTSS